MNDNLEDIVLDLRKRVEALESTLASLSSSQAGNDNAGEDNQSDSA